jgi:hypothetical protein
MINLEDPQWTTLKGGYRVLYDPRRALASIRRGVDSDTAWNELFNELHHQGDVGDASYAAIPYLIEIYLNSATSDWRLYALASCIEIERHRKTNPVLPDWLRDDYNMAWSSLVTLALRDLGESRDPLLLRAALGAVALGRGQLKLGAFISYADASDIDFALEEQLAWSTLYVTNRAG